MPLSAPVTATAVERSTGQIGRAAVAAMQVSGKGGFLVHEVFRALENLTGTQE